ncbi:hypothetical protein L7F22_033160 [Adiantum nelumboides]|nr:hypothetical protein [Adiantum nelumboides]
MAIINSASSWLRLHPMQPPKKALRPCALSLWSEVALFLATAGPVAYCRRLSNVGRTALALSSVAQVSTFNSDSSTNLATAIDSPLPSLSRAYLLAPYTLVKVSGGSSPASETAHGCP